MDARNLNARKCLWALYALCASSAFGFAVLASLGAARTTTLNRAVSDAMAGIAGAHQLVFAVAAAFAVIAAVLAVRLIRTRPSCAPNAGPLQARR